MSKAELQFGKLALQREWITSAHLSTCLQMQQQYAQQGQSVSLAQLMVQQRYLNQAQVTEILQQLKTIEKTAQRTIVTFGRYDLVEVVGEGGMGRVYRARDRQLGRIVALKLLLSEASIDVVRFLRGAKTTAHLKHPNIISLHDSGTENNQHFLVMDFIEGKSLQNYVGKPPAMRKTANIMHKIAKAIHYAHEEGIIHRDLKPANIMIDKDGEPKIMDFGLAKTQNSQLSQSGTVLGTLHYMPPEQASGDLRNIDVRSDIYALGAILYALLTGRTVFTGTTFGQVYQQILENKPTAPRKLRSTISLQLEMICLKALEKDKQKRYQTAQEFAKDLEKYLKGGKVKKGKSLKPAFLVLGFIFIIVLIVVVIYPQKAKPKKAFVKKEKAKKIVANKRTKQKNTSKAKTLEKNSDFQKLLQLSKSGNAVAMKELALIYSQGKQVKQNHAQAIHWFTKAANKENESAMLSLCAIYYKGIGTARNYKIFEKWCRKAIKLGNSTAMHHLGTYYERVKKEYKKALYWYHKGAAQNNPRCIYKLGLLHIKGTGVEKNYKLSAKLLEKSAQMGYVPAMVDLGVSYQGGGGVKRNYRRAVYWFKKASSLGNGQAFANLGVMYENGLGVEASLVKAVECYRKGAKLNHPISMKNLGFMFYQGLGVKKDPKQAIYWFTRAAKGGSKDAMVNLGNIYYEGCLLWTK